MIKATNTIRGIVTLAAVLACASPKMSVSGNLLDSRNFNNVKSGVVEVDYRADQAFDGPKSFFTVPDGKVFVLTDILISTNTRPAPCDPVTLRIYGSDALRTTIINCGEQQHIELQSGIPFQAAEDIRITSSHPNVIMGITIVGVERDPTQPSCLLSVGR